MSRVAEHSQDFNLFEVLFCFAFFWRGKKEYVFFFPSPKKKRSSVLFTKEWADSVALFSQEKHSEVNYMKANIAKNT